jgi:hypothetical protein
MSFFRHEEIYHCGEGDGGEGTIPQDRAPAHRNDESPAGYSSAGCAPAEPASASPAGAIIVHCILNGKIFAANGKLSPISLSQLRGAVPSATILPKAPTAKAACCKTALFITGERCLERVKKLTSVRRYGN